MVIYNTLDILYAMALHPKTLVSCPELVNLLEERKQQFVLRTEPICVCPIDELLNIGCPSARGQKCRSKK